MSDTITISKEEYRELVKDSDELNRLIINGVHNWEGYSIGIDDEDEDFYEPPLITCVDNTSRDYIGVSDISA